MTIYSRRKFIGHSAALVCGMISRRAFASSLPGQAIGASVSTRPFRLLVLGDSITWGQGLKEEHKFSYLVGDWLCQKRMKPACREQTLQQRPQIHVGAHSGATIFKYQDGDKTIKDRSPGEVPRRNPTVVGQVELAAKYYREQSIELNTIDVIFVNGGINDLHAARLFVPLPFARSIAEEADHYCNEKMALVLEQLSATFPNARIVIPGYLPVISEKTSGAALLEILKMTLVSPDEDVEKFLRHERARALIGKLGISESVERSIRHQFTEFSNTWAKASTAAFRQAADRTNLKYPFSSPVARTWRGAIPSALAKRVLVVEVPFKPENAYGAPNTYFWQSRRIDENLPCTEPVRGPKLTSDDELFRERACMCQKAGKANDLHCLRAGFMHPNREGAKAYRDAIVRELETILPFTGWV
ncbi:MAG: SGNH/GDSL hydrolase family protein [Pyrinomonadaceae bacterium]